MTIRSVLTAFLTAVAVLASACSSTDDTSSSTEQAAATSPTTTTPATTTTSPTTTSTTSAATSTTTAPAATAAPTTAASADATTTVAAEAVDWLTIVSDLSAVMDEIVITPQPDRIGEVAVIDGDWDRSTGSAIRTSHELGERTVGLDPTVVVSAELVSTNDDVTVDEALAVVVQVVIEAPDLSDARIVDANGETVFDLVNDTEPGELLTGLWTLVRTEDGWRVQRVTS